MFERMQCRLPLVGAPSDPRPIPLPQAFDSTRLSDVFAALGGGIFGEGAYRIHDPGAVERLTRLAVAAFPQLEGVVLCFASDWLGRQFALSTEEAPNGEPGVLLIDVQSDDVLHTDRDLVEFHDGLLAEDPEPALALELFEQWRAAGGEVPASGECVSFVVPVYLGGADELDNMAVSDLEVAWDLGGQLLRQVRELPEGTRISDIEILKPGA